MTSSQTGNKSLSLTFLFLLLTYFCFHILLRVLVSDSLDYDEAEQALLGQWLLAGYTEQPPLYTWMQYYLFQVFGKNVFAVSLLKNALLFFTYFFVYLSAQKLLKNTRAAILSASSLLLIPQIVWESQRDMTHTTLVVFAAASVLWLALRLVENRTLFNYCLFGLFCGIGILAKVNFVLFFIVLFLTLLTFPEGRKVFFSRMILVSLVILAAMSASYLVWMFNNQDIVFSATHKFKQAVEIYSIKGIKSFFTNTFLFLTPLWLFYLFIFPGGYIRKTNRPADFSSQFMFRYALIFIFIFIVLVLVFKISYVKDRWLQPLLFAAPLIFFSGLDVTTISKKQFKRFAMLSVIAAISIYIAFTVRVVGVSLTHHYCRLNYPFTALAEEIHKSGFSKGLIISDNRFLAGNMQFQFPDSIALIPNYNFEHLAHSSSHSSGHSKAIAVWKADASSKMPAQLKIFLKNRYDIDSIDYRVSLYEQPYKYNSSDSVKLAVLMFSLPAQRGHL